MKSNCKLSIRAVSLGDDLRQIAPLAQSIGYHGLQLDMAIGQLALSELSASGAREVRNIISSSNLELDSLFAGIPADMLISANQHDRVLWMFKKVLQTATALSAGICCLDLGRIPGVPQEAVARPTTRLASNLIIIPEPAPIEPFEAQIDPKELAAWDGIDVVMRELGAMAEDAGIILAFSTDLSSFASLSRLLAGARCHWFGVDLDPVSILRDRWDIERILDTLGASIRHIRGRDAIRGSAGRTQPATVGQGSTNWPQTLRLLDSGGYSGWIAIDTVELPDRPAAAQRALTHLKPKES